MKFIPNYRVSYKGDYYPAGVAFDIDEDDKDEVKVHGRVIEEERDAEPSDVEEEKKPSKKAGRPKKKS